MCLVKNREVTGIMFSALVCVCWLAAAAAATTGISRDAAIGADSVIYLDGTDWTVEYLPPPPPPPLAGLRGGPPRHNTPSDVRAAVKIGATVPGDLITDLQRAGLVGDPWTNTNFLDQAAAWDRPGRWRYRHQFKLPPSLAGSSRVLVLDGVKMGARVELDGQLLGVATDQFLRYTFPILAATTTATTTRVLTVTFDRSIEVLGRFMGSTGGWDWAPLSSSAIKGAGPSARQPTFSLGIWKSIYVATTAAGGASILHAAPHVFWAGGPTPARKLPGAAGPFRVSTRVFLRAPVATHGTVTVQGSWDGGRGERTAAIAVAIPAGEASVTVNLTVTEPALWWPAGMGNQTLHSLEIEFDPTAAGAPTVSVSRRIGFRTVAQVTTAPGDAVPDDEAPANGSGNFTMHLRVNGATMFARGSNHVPQEELEGRATAEASHRIMQSAAEGGMNTIRLWAGGVYEYDAWYDAADEFGLVVLHDLMFIEQGHGPCCPFYACASGWSCHQHPNVKNASERAAALDCSCDGNAGTTQRAEMQHQLRRLSHHPSIGVWEACNECGGYGRYADFVMTTVADEDKSRPIWPSSPANGWISGVHRDTGLPNGLPLVNSPGRTEAAVASLPCTACQCNLAGCSVADQHGPYVGGSGFCTVTDHDGGSSDCKLQHIDPMLPPPLGASAEAPVGVGHPGKFTSEFGCVGMSSFESMSGTLSAANWSVHAPPFRQRNWPMDDLAAAYFGTSRSQLALLTRTGARPFQAQLYQSMVAQLLKIKADVETFRAGNMFGALTWQLGEIWPTGGWGVVEYSGQGQPGQITGGRWKPLLYAMRQTVYRDQTVVCGTESNTTPNCCESCFILFSGFSPACFRPPPPHELAERGGVKILT